MSWDWDKLREQQEKNKKTRSSDGFSAKPPGDSSSGNPKQFDDALSFLKKFRAPGGMLFIVVLLLLFFGSTMVYTIQEGTVGIIQRFGQYNRTAQSGLHFKFPKGVENLTKVNIRKIRSAEFGSVAPAGRVSQYRYNASDVSMMLTGDLNVAIVPWIVQYRLESPRQYLFNVHNPEMLLTDLAEASMRLVVGDRSIDEVINKREEIASACMELLQKELEVSETGIRIVALELGKTNVPEPVQPSFNSVNKAEQEKETLIFKAQEDYNTVIPAAKGNAERTIRKAEGYAIDRVNRAKGDALRFNALYEEYKTAKDITKRRLYLETIREIYPKLGSKYIVDESQKNFLPLLNLGEKSDRVTLNQNQAKSKQTSGAE